MKSENVTIYTPSDRFDLPFYKVWLIMIRNVFQARDLVFQLLKKDLTIEYKKSYLGLGWLFISPLAGIISWVFMNSTGLIQPGDTGIPYPAYVLISTSIWGLFMNYYKSASQTFKYGSNLVNQIHLDLEIYLFEKAVLQFINFLFVFVLNIIVLLYFGIVPGWGILLFPFLSLPLFFLGSGIGLLASILSVITVDLSKLINQLMGLLIWITPVIYSSKYDNPIVQNVIKWNPLTYLIGTTRDIITQGTAESWDAFMLSFILSLTLFLIVTRLFFLTERKLIERMI